MPSIFISYRRDDTSGQAGRLSDRLISAFGAGQVFMDVEDIPPGENFVSVLQRNVQQCEVVLVLIGPRWLDAKKSDGTRRLDDKHDFVRTEVVSALTQGKRVIPVLINRTSMPGAAQLPSPLQALAQCQAVELADASFDRDAAALIETLGSATARGRTSNSAWRRRGVIAIAAVLGLLATAQLLRGPLLRSSDESAKAAQAVSGDWEADVFYEWDGRSVREPFTFGFIAGQLTGSAGYLGYPRGILSGDVKGRSIVFETRSQATLNDKPIEYVHRYRGEISGDEIRMVMQTTGPYQNGEPREFVLRRVKP